MPELADVSDDALIEKVVKAQDDRLFYVSEAIRRGYTPEEIAELTKIDIFYLDKLLHIFEIEQELGAHTQDLDVLKTAKLNGFQTVRLQNYGKRLQTKFVNFAWKTRLSQSTRWSILVRQSLTLKHHISIQPMVGKMNLSDLIRNPS